jgi:site-specific recombinase XerD
VNDGYRRSQVITGLDMTEQNEAHFQGLRRALYQASPKTVAAYHQGCLSLQRYLEVTGADTDLLAVTRDRVHGWLGELRRAGGWSLGPDSVSLVQRGRPLAKDSLNSYFCSARRFYNWALAEELITVSPFAGVAQPRPADTPVKIPELGLIQGMLATCRPKGRKPAFIDLRDEFLIRAFCETGGPRCAEIANLPLGKLDLRQDLITLDGKGGKVRQIAMSPKTAMAAQRYLRARAAHKWAGLPYAVLGLRGQMNTRGVYDAVRTRAQACGGDIHPHQLRHFAAHTAKEAEMTDSNLMILFGWTTPRMLARYGKEQERQRALDSSRRHALGNAL